MLTRYQRRLVLLILTALLVQSTESSQREASVKVEAEVNLLKKSLAAKPDSDPQWKDAKSGIEKSLEQAADDLQSGRLYASLEHLTGALVSFRGLESANAKTDEELLNEGLSGIEAEAKKARTMLAVSDQQSEQNAAIQSPLVVRALTQTAEGDAAGSIEGGRGFALLDGLASDRVNNFSSALFYIGSAEAWAEAITFYRSLNLPRKGASFSLRSVSVELGRLQARTAAAFQPPRSTEQHAGFIRLNATLKQARELDDARRYAGAMYKYLDAVQQFGMLDSVAPNLEKRSELEGEIQKMRALLNSPERDSSIAQLFLERAESRLAKLPGEDDWKLVQAVAEQVMPAYFSILKPAGVQDLPAATEVTVTLVRWPYT